MSGYDDDPKPFNPFEMFQKALEGSKQQIATQELKFHEVISRNKAVFVRALRQYHHLFNKPHTFESGDLVKWKPFMENCRLPCTDLPAIVIEVLDPPIISTHEINPHNPNFREKLDLILSVYTNSAETCPFIHYYYDSRFFMPYSETVPDEEISSIVEMGSLMKEYAHKTRIPKPE